MANQEFNNLLSNYKIKINELIIRELKNRRPKSLYNPLIYFFNSGGKRLRAILLLLCARSINNDKYSEPINQAIAIELLHNFTLIHDDIMDNSVKRHNKKTLHLKYDISTAILAGDSLLALAYEFLNKGLTQNLEEIFSEFTRALTVVCEGQALDKEYENKKRVSVNDYYEMISKKTGALIKATCRIGALTQTNDKYIIDKLGEFGELIGIAFQIQDDLLDVVGNERLFGKKLGSDLVEGKKTFLLVNALKKARENDLKKLNKLIENKGINPDQIIKYIDIYKKLGIIDFTQKEIQKFHQKILDILNELDKKIFVEELREFLRLIITRKN